MRRTAKAVRISLKVKSDGAGEWGGCGRLSEDGPGHYNPDRSEGHWGRTKSPHGGAKRENTCQTQSWNPGTNLKRREGERQTKQLMGRPFLICQP